MGTVKGLILLSYIWVTITDFTKSAKEEELSNTFFYSEAGGTMNIGKDFRTDLELVTTGRFRYLTV